MDSKLVWSDELGDLRKKKDKDLQKTVDEQSVELHLRRLTSGKGRTIIEISNIPNNKSWCKKLAKDLKKKLATGGAFKEDRIEVHGEQIDKIKTFLEEKRLKFKQIGG